MDGESKRSHNRFGVILQNQPSEPESLPLDYLREITNNFCDEHLLGKGGFGIVYKGVKQNGDMIAVKKLALTEPGSQDRQFENEVRHLMGLKHPNIVQLVGYCSETQIIPLLYKGKYICAEKSERFICLEYLPKGSLREHLSDEKSGLDWDTRYRIIQGICYGLHYLHEEWNVNTPVIHMDLKPPNILLDDNLVPKISDFGLSRLFGEEQTRTCTASRDGTLGYMAPEYINRGIITKKLDIFSLGVIIIEIITGRKDYPYENETSSQKFTKLVLKNWRNRLKNASRYAFLETDYQQIRRCIEIGLACVKVDWEERPTTCQIIKLLHGLEGAEYNNERLWPALVPSAPKPEAAPFGDASTAAAAAPAGTRAAGSPQGLAAAAVADRDGAADRDLLCPICMAVIKDAFLTACGHSFCYMCIVTHLSHKSDCPCCGHYLTKAQLYPNFLLDKLLDMRVIAELRQGDLFHTASLVTSIEFDRDDELFATAGVSKHIKVFEFSSVVNEPSDVHCPVVEMANRSKLSSLSWNKYSKNVIASSDYEGIVTVWDVQTHQSVMKYEEHELRAWSVDFSHTEPSMLVSGSDDCKVKVWCINQEASVINIDMEANVCSVKYNPGSNYYVAVGSADHHIHYFDLRNPSAPVQVFRGHKNAVSYVKFLSNNEFASASTDSTLRLWDVEDNFPVRTFRGHKNEKNFVGLSVNNDYIACGSETNEVFVYHKAISIPAVSHRFVSSDLDDADDNPGSHFISAVCWKSDSPTMLTANSQGTIKVLVLAP